MTDQRTHTAAPDWASRMDPGNLLYGAIVATAALAVGAGRGETAADMTETMATTLVVYWLAHIYRYRAGTPRGQCDALHKLIWDSAKNESAILGGMPAVIVASALTVAGISLWLSAWFDLGTGIVVLVLVGFLVGLRAGVHGWRLSAEALSAAILGGILAALLVSLHRH